MTAKSQFREIAGGEPRRRGDTPPSSGDTAAGTLPTHQKFVLIRVSGEKEILMRWPQIADGWKRRLPSTAWTIRLQALTI